MPIPEMKLKMDEELVATESMAVLTHLQSHGESAVEETDLALEAVYLGAALETFWQDLEGQLLT